MCDEGDVIELGSDTDSDEWEQEEGRDRHGASQYNQEQRDAIQEVVGIGFAEQMVIAALEITNFSKLKAINLLLANEETKRRWNWEIGYELAPKKVNRYVEHNMVLTARKKDEAKEIAPARKKQSDSKRKDRGHGEQDVMAQVGEEDEPVLEAPGVEWREPIENAKPKLHIRSSQREVFTKKENVGKLSVTLNTVVGLKHGATYCVLTVEGKEVKSRQMEKSKTLEFNEVFHFRGFSLDAKRRIGIRLMNSNWFFSDSVIGRAFYTLPTAFNRHFRDCVPLSDSKNTTVGFVMISAVVLEHEGSGEFGWG